MKTLNNPGDKEILLGRLTSLTPDSSRRWGTMSPNQMVCHLTDSFRAALGEAHVSTAINLLNRTVAKWIALKTPLPWPHGVKTRPEMDQQRGGTRPVGFKQDVSGLLETIDRFVGKADSLTGRIHPLFGPMTSEEWLRWGYLHVDHHLRQFGL